MDRRGGMIVRFWGVRGSYPVTGAGAVRYGGNTACVEVEAGSNTIILDAGTGIIPLGKELVRRARERGRKASCVLLLSHLHFDHTQGFPFFAPAFIPGASLAVFGPDFLGSAPQTALEQIMQPPYFPVRLADLNADVKFGALRQTDLLLVKDNQVSMVSSGNIPDDPQTLTVRILHSYAHPGGVFHYRLDWQGASLVYATDTEGYVNGDRRLASFARGADLLIHDAQYTDDHYLGLVPGLSVTQGFGHSTVSMACQAARAAEVKMLALFHHAPEYSDQQMDEISSRAGEFFHGAFAAAEGVELHLGPSPSSPQRANLALLSHKPGL